jgi:uncharacterized protein with HEPN domain
MKPGMKRDCLDFLQDIVEAMTGAVSFVEGMEFADFIRDKKTAYATIKALEIIGEAVAHIPDSLKTDYPQVPWKEISAMRNKLIHEYFGSSMSIVWNTVKSDIPALLPLFEDILKNRSR